MADIHQPHDRLFRSVFSDASEAASLLQGTLPDTLRDSFDWTTLTLLDGTFIDEDLHESQSDLLYQVEHTGTGQPVSMYLLFEHQSSPDPWLRLRLLRYCCRIWEEDRRSDPERSELRPIVPVVFYQARAAGAIRPNSATCFLPARGPCHGCRGLPTSFWIRRPSNLDRSKAVSGAVSSSC